MNRRTFIHATLGLTGGLGLAEADTPVGSLLRMLEDSPREHVPRELVRRIRAGAHYEQVLAAVCLANVRNVQPYPDVGFKYHTVMMLRAIDASSEHQPPADRWLPIIWAADYFKECQAEEHSSSGWRQPATPTLPAGDAEAVRRSLTGALDRWDREAADAAIARYCRIASVEEIFAVLFAYGLRDLRAIGHKAIAVSNAHLLTGLLGSAQAEPLLRSTVAALLNSDEDPNPGAHDLSPDRPWRENEKRLSQIPASWGHGQDDAGARVQLRAALYQTPPEEAGAVVVELLRRGVAPEAIWQVLFDTAAELVLHQPGIVALHSQTTANALHYTYLASHDDRTRQLTLLQCAAFVAMFRQMTGARMADLDLTALPPQRPNHTGEDAIAEIFAELTAGRRLQAAQKCLGFLNEGGDAARIMATARHHVAYGAQEPHDYKFAEAMFENYAQLPDCTWRPRFLSAGMAYFKAPPRRPVPVVAEAKELFAT
jgi:hypothetical protein